MKISVDASTGNVLFTDSSNVVLVAMGPGCYQIHNTGTKIEIRQAGAICLIVNPSEVTHVGGSAFPADDDPPLTDAARAAELMTYLQDTAFDFKP